MFSGQALEKASEESAGDELQLGVFVDIDRKVAALAQVQRYLATVLYRTIHFVEVQIQAEHRAMQRCNGVQRGNLVTVSDRFECHLGPVDDHHVQPTDRIIEVFITEEEPGHVQLKVMEVIPQVFVLYHRSTERLEIAVTGKAPNIFLLQQVIGFAPCSATTTSSGDVRVLMAIH